MNKELLSECEVIQFCIGPLVNVTGNAVRLVHKPTVMHVDKMEHKSQRKNLRGALIELEEKLKEGGK